MILQEINELILYGVIYSLIFLGKIILQLASIKFNAPSISQIIDEITGEQINSIPINISSETAMGYMISWEVKLF